MRATPIPDWWTGARVVVGESDPTRDDVRPCEYAVTDSTIFPGRPAVHARVELDDRDREVLAAGGVLWMCMDGGELPWSIVAEPSDSTGGIR